MYTLCKSPTKRDNLLYFISFFTLFNLSKIYFFVFFYGFILSLIFNTHQDHFSPSPLKKLKHSISMCDLCFKYIYFNIYNIYVDKQNIDSICLLEHIYIAGEYLCVRKSQKKG